MNILLKLLVGRELAESEALLAEIAQSAPQPIKKTCEYLVANRGVRLLTAITAGRMCGLRGKRLSRLAASFELIHLAVLAHDDVIDAAPIRGGKPTPNLLWGNASTVLAGDFLIAEAAALLAGESNQRILQMHGKTARDTIEGALLERGTKGNPRIGEKEYLGMISKKTATLISSAFRVAAAAAQAPPEKEERLAEFGRLFGMAAQINDDCLDYAPGRGYGKKRFMDYLNGIPTLPLIKALENCSPRERKILESGFGKNNGSSAALRAARIKERKDGINY